MGTNTGHVMTLANSIIGVSVLAMPFCFKQCGILLAALVLLLSNIMSRLACHYILKSAILSRRRTFEFLAFHVFGPTGKLTVELSIIGFMLGTCVAYFVVVGDLGPAIIAPILNLETPAHIRPTVLIALAVFVVLPLGLLRNVDSLASVCAVTIAFYLCLVLKVMGEATNHLIAHDWMDKVNLWRPAGILQCLPIFSMALSCQTQLFEIFESLPNASLDKMNSVVRSAINICTAVYMAMGVFGYIAYCTQQFTGNVMMSFSETMTSEVIKLGFVLSVAVSFPLVIFPCRASLHSLLFRRTHHHHELMGTRNYIPEKHFQCITVLIITVSLITGLLIPNIELVLGLVGSTIGVIICIMVPAVMFLCLTNKNNNERLLAQVLFVVGLLIMVLGTYANLYATEEAMSRPEPNIPKVPPVIAEAPNVVNMDQLPIHQDKMEPKAVVKIKDETLKELKDVKELAALPELKKDNTPSPPAIIQVNKFEENKNEVRKEPPVPVAPVVDIVTERALLPVPNLNLPVEKIPEKEPPEQVKLETNIKAIEVEKKEETIAKEAIKKEEDEIKEVENQNKEANRKEKDLINNVVKQEIKKEKKKELIEKYVQNEEEKEKINAEQKQILEEIKKEDKKEKLAENVADKIPEDIKNIIEENKDNKIQNDVIGKVESDLKFVKDEGNFAKKPLNDVNEQNLEVKQKDSSTMNKKMIKGIPLPIAVQDNFKEKNVVNDLKPVDLQNTLKVEGGVDDKVLRREILGNKAQDEKEDRTKRDLEASDIKKLKSEGKDIDAIEGGGDGMKEKVEESVNTDVKKTDKEIKEINEDSKEIGEIKNDSVKQQKEELKAEKTFAQLLKDNKVKENKEEHCENDKKSDDIKVENKPKEIVPNNVNVKEVEDKITSGKNTVEKVSVDETPTKESLIKTPEFLSNPLPILFDKNLKPDIARNDLLNDVKPMKRDLKSLDLEKREAKDRET